MLWPVLLLLASVVLILLGWVGFCTAFMDPAPRPGFWQTSTLFWCLPIGIGALAVAVVWLAILFLRWLGWA